MALLPAPASLPPRPAGDGGGTGACAERASTGSDRRHGPIGTRPPEGRRRIRRIRP